MRETTLHNFFAGSGSIQELRSGLADVVGKSTLRTGANLISDLAHDFGITPQHLLKICDAFLLGELGAEEVKAAAFVLIGSDHFIWDTDSPDGDLVGEVLFDWSAPEVNYPLTSDNVEKYRRGLTSGVYPFARSGVS